MSDDYSLIPKDSSFRDPLTWILLCLICCAVLIVSYAVYEMLIASTEAEQQKKLVNSLSCADLGSYIIKNAMNDSYSQPNGDLSDVYHLAQSRYLVCTHTPSSEMSS